MKIVYKNKILKKNLLTLEEELKRKKKIEEYWKAKKLNKNKAILSN